MADDLARIAARSVLFCIGLLFSLAAWMLLMLTGRTSWTKTPKRR